MSASSKSHACLRVGRERLWSRACVSLRLRASASSERHASLCPAQRRLQLWRRMSSVGHECLWSWACSSQGETRSLRHGNSLRLHTRVRNPSARRAHQPARASKIEKRPASVKIPERPQPMGDRTSPEATATTTARASSMRPRRRRTAFPFASMLQANFTLTP